MSSEPHVPISNVFLTGIACIAIGFLLGLGCGDGIGHKEALNMVCKERKVDCPVEFKIP